MNDNKINLKKNDKYRLSILKPKSELPPEIVEAIVNLSESPERHIQAASVVLYGLSSLDEPISYITTKDVNALLERAPRRLITNPFKVFDPMSRERSIYSLMLEFLLREEYITVLRRGSGSRATVIELISPVWCKHLKSVSKETKELLLSESKEKSHALIQEPA